MVYHVAKSLSFLPSSVRGISIWKNRQIGKIKIAVAQDRFDYTVITDVKLGAL